MKKHSIFLASLIILALGGNAVFYPQAKRLAQGNSLQAVDLTPVAGQLCVQLGDSIYCWNVTQSTLTVTPVANTPTPSNTPTATRTKTSTPPVATRTATATGAAVITPTTSSGNIPAYAAGPACPTHDPNQWHALWDSARGCHYDHTHADDPALANSYFGPLGAFWDGTTISYPFNSGPSENTQKHAGYKISVRMPGWHPWPPCGTEDNTDITGDHSDNCVIASRTEYHVVGGLMDLVGRYHSYWMEVYICKPPYRQPQDCGIMRTGGLLDYAELKAPHYNGRIVRTGGTIDFGNGITTTYTADGPDLPANSGEPYVFSIPYTEADRQSYRNNPPKATLTQAGKATIDQWSSNDFDCEPRPAGDPCHNQYTHGLFQVGDAFNLVDTQNLNTLRWICYGEPNCEYNGSLIGMNEIAVRVMQSWQQGGGGFVTLTGWSDRWGNPRLTNTTCTSVSIDCVPFILNHAPVGVAASRSDNLCECQVWEYDHYFNGRPSNWIKFPN